MLRYGFFDSIRGDRKYNSRDVAELFDGIIVDGIYAQIGEKFSVNPKKVIETEEDKMTVTVGTGQAWLSHTKILNTSKMEFVIAEGVGVNRYDALIIEVNDNTRTADIFVKKNVRTNNNSDLAGNTTINYDLVDGQLIRTEFVHQYLLAVIYVEGGTDRIRQENIASKVGFAIPDGIPYVTCPLEPFPADETLKQWVAQWNTFFNNSDTRFNNFMTGASGLFDAAQNDRTTKFNAAQTQRNTDYQALRQSIVNWLNSTETDWNTWYASVKNDFEGYVDNKISDLRASLNALTTRLNTLANSDDTALDQLSEIVAFIKTNRSLIEQLSNAGSVLNSKDNAGVVAAGNGNLRKAWMTDHFGNPGWLSNFFYVGSTIDGTSINGNTNIDALSVPGVYDVGESKYVTGDHPFTFWCTVYVTNFRNSRIQQIAIPWSENEKRIAFRTSNDNGVTWVAWEYIYTINNVLPIASGGTGGNTARQAALNLLVGLSDIQEDGMFSDFDWIIGGYIGNAFRMPITAMWDYINHKRTDVIINQSDNTTPIWIMCSKNEPRKIVFLELIYQHNKYPYIIYIYYDVSIERPKADIVYESLYSINYFDIQMSYNDRLNISLKSTTQGATGRVYKLF